VTPFTQRTEVPEREAGEEPLPGYRLIAPLGRGGFGEVWKCEVPGGLHKAIKFVLAGGEECRRELAAFEQVKAIRHPYLLTLERVELTGDELIMVMELADCQLQDRFRESRAEGNVGIPRDELLGYIREAAEALDMINTRYGLQHLDVKPQNLFVIAGHMKVGDYGLVRRTERTAITQGYRGFTPRYTAPEVLQGAVDPRSDQYSLALVYAELLTGTFPYPGQTAPQLILQHVTAAPDLSALPPQDRSAVARALAKEPAQRFATCSAFVRALLTSPEPAPLPARPVPADPPLTPAPGPGDTTIPPGSQSEAARATAETRQPEGTTVARRTRRRGEDAPAEKPPNPFEGFRTVMPIDRLHGSPAQGGPNAEISAGNYVALVVRAATERLALPSEPELPEGALTSRFLCTLPPPMVPLKLAVVAERWGLTPRQTDGQRMELRRDEASDSRRPQKADARGIPPKPPGGLEVVVRIPAPPSAELRVTTNLYGDPEDAFARTARDEMPSILDDIRRTLQTLQERRAHARVQATFPVRIYPLYGDGVVGTPVSGRCRDISPGGVRFVTPTPIRTERIYIAFEDIGAVAELAVYARVVRSGADTSSAGYSTAGRFRTSSQT
jgi:serine/threonine protein kinase